jgi:BirA family biotin operon repressor/biotin-[acetyl-CoA-carboxylase] ligase
LVVVVGEQTGGRGRRQRVWQSPPGSISLSIVLRPEVAQLPELIMLASLAVARAVREVTGLSPQLKWPNDILLDGKKVCGILVESEIKGRLAQAVIGIGINVNNPAPVLAERTAPVTSLATAAGKPQPLLELVRRLLAAADDLYDRLHSGGSLYEMWRDSLITLGQEVRVTSDEGELVGVAEAVDRDGSLWVRDGAGTRHRVIASDVSLRRRA